MPMRLFRNTQNENMGEAGSIPHRHRYCNSRGYCEIYKKNLADSHWVSSFDWNHRGWLMDPHCGLSPRGERSPCPTLEHWKSFYWHWTCSYFQLLFSRQFSSYFYYVCVFVGYCTWLMHDASVKRHWYYLSWHDFCTFCDRNNIYGEMEHGQHAGDGGDGWGPAAERT